MRDVTQHFSYNLTIGLILLATVTEHDNLAHVQDFSITWEFNTSVHLNFPVPLTRA